MPKGGTRHALFAGVRPCPFCAGNIHVLFVACSVLSLKFVGVAVRVAVQANAVQQCLTPLERSTIHASQFLVSLMHPRGPPPVRIFPKLSLLYETGAISPHIMLKIADGENSITFSFA